MFQIACILNPLDFFMNRKYWCILIEQCTQTSFRKYQSLCSADPIRRGAVECRGTDLHNRPVFFTTTKERRGYNRSAKKTPSGKVSAN